MRSREIAISSLIAAFTLISVVVSRCAVPSQTDFDTTYFTTNALPISLTGNLTNWSKLGTNYSVQGTPGTLINTTTPTVAGQLVEFTGTDGTNTTKSLTPTGTGAPVRAISPALTGTPTINGAGIEAQLTNRVLKAGDSMSGTLSVTGFTNSANTASRVIGTAADKSETTSFASAALINSLSDETGTSLAVFNTSPTFNTSLTITNAATGTVPFTINHASGASAVAYAVTVGGSSIQTLSSAGKLLTLPLSGFSASVCAYGIGDGGRGIYSSAASNIGLAANGLGLLGVDSSLLDVALPANVKLGWNAVNATTSISPTLTTILGQESAAVIQLGDDAATATAQTLKGHDGSGTDKNGANLTIAGGQPTGAGVPGRLAGKSSFTSTTGSSLNAYTTPFYIGGTLKVDTTTTGNVGGGEDNLITYTIPANQLAINGDAIEFDVAGSFAADAHLKTLKVYFGSTAIISSTSLVFNNLDWRAHGKIVRTAAATQKATCELTVGGTLLSAVNSTITDYTTPAETLSGTVVFKCTGSDDDGISPANDAVVQQIMHLKWLPNGN